MTTAAQDLTKGYVPLVLIATFVIPTAIYVGLYLGKRDTAADNMLAQLAALQTQVSSLSTQVSQISVAVAKGPTLPENVAYKADLLRFCLANKNLICPPF
jgi:hypothetical protein